MSIFAADTGDKEYITDRPLYIIWALGKLDRNKEPAFHDKYPKANISILVNPKEPTNNCFAFTRDETGKKNKTEIWDKTELDGKASRVFNAYLGPSGSLKGYQGLTGNTID